jgi:predicted nucleotidyltransferase
MNAYKSSLQVLSDAAVQFVVIGGVAATARGSARVTFDLDICYERSQGNLERLCKALAPYHPHVRGAPRDLPFELDTVKLKRGMNFTLTTDLGDLDLLGEIAGIGQYPEAVAQSDHVELYGTPCQVLKLTALIRSKRVAGRSKDHEALHELEALAELEKAARDVRKPESGDES